MKRSSARGVAWATLRKLLARMKEEETGRPEIEDGTSLSEPPVTAKPNERTPGTEPSGPASMPETSPIPLPARGDSGDIRVQPARGSDFSTVSVGAIRQDRLRILVGLKRHRLTQQRTLAHLGRLFPAHRHPAAPHSLPQALPAGAEAVDRRIDEELAALLKELPPEGSA